MNALREIIWISYLDQSYQKDSFMRQRLWVRAFQLSDSIVDLFGKEQAKKLMDNHLHNIISHFPETFEEGSLQEISTERFESFNNQKKLTILLILYLN